MNKPVVTDSEGKEKLDLEGALFYFLLISVIALLPIGSVILLFSVV